MTRPDPAEAYVRLAHAIDAHSAGFIDGYGGPPGWAVREARAPRVLVAEAEALLSDVAGVPDDARREWLVAQVEAMHTMTRLLAGERLSYEDEVRGLYGIEPVRADVQTLEAGLAELDAALPGAGSLPERLEALRERVVVPRESILSLAEPILAELRRRTVERYGLPDGEQFTIGLVTDQPWSGYNWPLGNLTSRIDINTDLPVLLPALPDLLAHEGYPGHHTEHSRKEAGLVRERGWLEHSVQLINAPECVVSEGVATNALRAVMPREEVEAWLTGELAQRAGLRGEDVRALLDASRAQRSMRLVNGTAALMLHADGVPEAEVLAFVRRYALSTEARAAQTLRFLNNPSFRAYSFTYAVGEGLVRAFMDARGPAGFSELLAEPFTPAQLQSAGDRVTPA